MKAKKPVSSNKSLQHKAEKKVLEDIIAKKNDELNAAFKELAYQHEEKEKRAAELIISNIEHVIQSEEKVKRAEELILANIELAFQNEEKSKRSAELIIANIELAFQNEEKKKRAAELVIAKIELAFQNKEKGNRAAELVIANIELAYQIKEKKKRASELIIVNEEHAIENIEKDKKATELKAINTELEQFAYRASHDLQQPLRTVSNYLGMFEERYLNNLDSDAQKYLTSVKGVTKRMSELIKSLLSFSQVGQSKVLSYVNLKKLLDEVTGDLSFLIKKSKTVIEIGQMPSLNIYEAEIRQLFQNLITNAIKFQRKDTEPHIKISAKKLKGKTKFLVEDNGIGIEEKYFSKIFDIFSRLHGNSDYEGSGIGLANCKKIIELHKGEIWIESVPGKGSCFYFTIPNL